MFFSGRSEIFDLTRFPVSDGAEIKCCTFCTILDRKHFLKLRTFWKFYGNVGNWMLNRLEALPVAYGTSVAAETSPEVQKSLFLDWKHLIVE